MNCAIFATQLSPGAICFIQTGVNASIVLHNIASVLYDISAANYIRDPQLLLSVCNHANVRINYIIKVDTQLNSFYDYIMFVQNKWLNGYIIV